MNETETFQHYQVLKREDGSLWELGRGAMGVTYKAFDVNLRCHVALKVISNQFLDSEVARARFLREARAAAGLRHRNVASVYHLGDEADSFFYSMEFIDGQTVEALVSSRGPLPATDALQVALQVARALGAAAKQGVVHRDIKPANLMVVHEDEEEEQGFVVKVIDFGLARSALQGGEHSGHITMGGFVGTPQYASPEQIEEKDLDVRSDIYSLGVTLWYMLVGQPPFKGSVFQIGSQHLTKEPPWADLADKVPAPAVDLLRRLLQKDPASRPQTPVKLRLEIEACLRQLPAGSASPLADALPPAQADTVSPEEAAALVTMVQGPAPTEGRIFAGRYQLSALVGEGASGRTFRAYDGRRDGKLVAVKVLHPELHLSPEAFYHLQGDLGRLRDALHPHLIETFLLERVHGYKFSVMEWVNGWPLSALLQRPDPLPLRDALNLLGQAAGAAAHCSEHHLHRLDLSPDKILLHFSAIDEEAAPPEASSLFGQTVDQWPGFSLKMDALSPAREAGGSTARGSSGASPRRPGRDTFSSIRGLLAGNYFHGLGVLLQALLGADLSSAASPDQPVIPALNADANEVLRRAFLPEPGFATETHFFNALLKACNLRREDVGLPRSPLDDAPSATTARTAAPPAGPIASAKVSSEPRPSEARPATPPRPSTAPPTRPEVRAVSPVTLPPPLSPSPSQKTFTGDQTIVPPTPEPPPPVVARAPVPEKWSPAPVAPKITPAERLPVPPPSETPGVGEPVLARDLPVLPPEPAPVSPAADTLAPPRAVSPDALAPVPAIPVTQESLVAAPIPAAASRDRAPKRPVPTAIWALAAILVLGGVIVALIPSKRPTPPIPDTHIDTHPKVSANSVSPSLAATPLPTTAPKVALLATPPPAVDPVSNPTATPAATSTPSAEEIPAVMEAVPDTDRSTPPAPTPGATVVAVAHPTPANSTISTPPSTPTPRQGTRGTALPTPRLAASPSPTPKRNVGEKPVIKAKPVPTPAPKPTPRPPRNDDDVPAFMR